MKIIPVGMISREAMRTGKNNQQPFSLSNFLAELLLLLQRGKMRNTPCILLSFHLKSSLPLHTLLGRRSFFSVQTSEEDPMSTCIFLSSKKYSIALHTRVISSNLILMGGH